MKNRQLLLQPNLDVHVHTPYSVCCEDITLDKLREKAQRTKLAYVITDHSAHLYFPKELAWSMMRADFPALFAAYRDEGKRNIEKYLSVLKAHGVLTGIELDIYSDESLVFEEDLLPDLDLVIGSLHVLDSLQKKLAPESIISEFKRLTLSLLASGKVDVLGHPLRILLHAKIPFPDELIHWVVDNCGKHNVALEINSHYKYPDIDIKMARLSREKNVLLVKGSDAHALIEFGDYSYHAEVLLRSGKTRA